MKKIASFVGLIMLMACANGQRSVDRLFEKYSDSEGFTCITISGNLLDIAASSLDDGEESDIKAKITEVRILAQKDKSFDVGNFHDIIMRNIDQGNYEEFMRVKDTDQDMRVLVRSNGRRISEFLLVAGGNENAVIQVKGDMSVSDAKKLCDNARRKHGTDIF